MSSPQLATTPESELLVVQEAARMVARSTDPETAIHGILRLLSQLLGLNRGRVLLPDERTGALKIRYAYGLTREERERGQYAVGEGVTGRVFQTGQLALVQSIDDEPTYLARAVDRSVLPNEEVSFLAVPIKLDEAPIGALAVHRLRKRNRPFQRDLALLQVLATLMGQALRIRDIVAERTAHLLSENQLLKNRLESRGARFGIIGQSPSLQQAIQQALQVARTSTTVLLLGESGTGKEKFARMQHIASDRANGPFVSINCAAIPSSLIESELFGHEKGAFTGATASKRGRIESASGGTLFLDEIGDLDFELQAKLLRVLESRMIQRVGSTKDIPVDVRIVAATHQNLQEAVNEGRFRLDLFYRLNVFPIRLPALRARHGDVPILARHFLNAANQEYEKNLIFGLRALEALEKYSWPGNIRQLENLVKRAVLLSPEGAISRQLIEEILQDEDGIHGAAARDQAPAQQRRSEPRAAAPSGFEAGVRPYARVQEDEVGRIVDALRHHHGNKTRAAISLGLTPRQLRYRMSKLEIHA
jgi:Nif-specific regulatory protein